MTLDTSATFRRRSLTNTGLAHLFRGEWDMAAKDLGDALAMAPDAAALADAVEAAAEARAHGTFNPLKIAQIAKSLGFTSAAGHCIRSALAADGDHAEGWWAAAQELSPQEALGHRMRAAYYAGKFRTAFSFWRKVDKMPTELGVDILCRTGRLGTAAALAGEIAQPLVRLQHQGEIALFEGREEDALDNLRGCAQDTDVALRTAHYALGALILTGRTSEVEGFMRRCPALHEGNILGYMGMAAAAGGDIAEARELAEKAQSLAHAAGVDSSELYMACGLIGQATGDFERALEWHSLAARNAPRVPLVPLALLSLGTLEARMRLPDRGEDHLGQARRIHRGAVNYLLSVIRAVTKLDPEAVGGRV